MKPAQVDRAVVEHWMRIVSAESYSAQDFYKTLEASVVAQKCPDLAPSRVDLSEGGALSAKREYLRFARERIVFDVCAAPVGINFFFSYRFYVLLPVIKLWHVAYLAVAVALLLYLALKLLGLLLGVVVLGVAFAVLVWLMRNAVGMGLRNVDETLLNMVGIGPIYERYFRKDTYYRQDMRMAYGSIVSSIVKAEVAKLTAEKGPHLIRDYSYSPVFEGLYEAKRLVPADA